MSISALQAEYEIWYKELKNIYLHRPGTEVLAVLENCNQDYRKIKLIDPHLNLFQGLLIEEELSYAAGNRYVYFALVRICTCIYEQQQERTNSRKHDNID
nr:unnamed protein product [Callosobruchus chinensis]